MAVYIVTGKLGGGKSLVSVHRIHEYLVQGRPVATNLDLNLVNMLGKHSKQCRVYRVPDHPDYESISALGRAYEGPYDESKTGLIVLDECATWLNARNWQEKGRSQLLDYLIHIRKMGWDLLLIIQDISALDKQFRKLLAEHVVYCRRTDRMSIPLVTFLGSIAGFNIRFPKMHFGIVKYGDLPTSLTVDRWTYYGVSMYSAYDTNQIFSDTYDKGLYTMLPPYYLTRNSLAKRGFNFYMRLSKIYFKKFSRLVSFFAGLAFFCGLYFVDKYYLEADLLPGAKAFSQAKAPDQIDPSDFKYPESKQEPNSLISISFNDPGISQVEDYSDLFITGYILHANRPFYFFENREGYKYSSADLRIRGFHIKPRGRCSVQLVKAGKVVTLYCDSAPAGDDLEDDGFLGDALADADL